jgi:hypothetical protein
MQSLILSECLVGGASPFAALTSADAARFGIANAVFVGRPKDFKDAYLPQCCVWIPPETEVVEVASNAGRVYAEFEARAGVRGHARRLVRRRAADPEHPRRAAACAGTPREARRHCQHLHRE